MARTSISATLAAGSVAYPYFYDVVITENLCKKACSSQAPVFSPVFSIVGTSLVGTGQYEVTVRVQGICSYVPCGSCNCCNKSQTINTTFVLPVYSANAPTAISVAGGAVNNTIVTSGCSSCGNVMRSDCALTLTVATT